MNADELIEEVANIVTEPSYDDDEDVFLRYLNQAMNAIAGQLLLPALADGYGTVTTVTDGFTIDLPEDYHKGLFLAQCDGVPVEVFRDLKSIATFFGGLKSSESGDVAGVVTSARRFIYQRVPTEATDIEIFYYRRPVPMEEGSDSYPDGLFTSVVGNDDLDWALIHHACWKIFSKIEQGIDGAKVDTMYHQGLFKERLDDLKDHCIREGQNFATQATNKVY